MTLTAWVRIYKIPHMSQPADDAGLLPEDVFRVRMRELRRAQGLKQSDLAEGVTALGVPLSQPAIAMIESGKTERISLGAALAIAAVLDVPLEDLYRARLDWTDFLVAREEEPGITESLAWLRTWRKARRNATRREQET